MNLMFWKKKNAGDSSAEIAPQDAGDQAEGQKSQDSASPDAETSKQPGLFARIKSRLTRGSQKTSEPETEEDKEPAADTHRRSERDSDDDADSAESKKPGLFALIKERLSSLTGRSKEAADEEEVVDTRRRAIPEAEAAPEVAEAVEHKHSSTGWIIGGVILLWVLLGAGIYAAWDYILPPLKRKNFAHETVKAYRNRLQDPKAAPQQAEPPPAESPQTVPPPAGSDAPANVQQPAAQPIQLTQPVQPAQPTQPAKQPAANALPTSSKGDLVVGDKSAKETAMSLKEAIKAMNGDPAEPAKKSAK